MSQQVVGFGDQLDVRVLDAVMDHLHVMAGAARSDVGAARVAIHVGADFCQHGLDLLIGVAGAARHDAGPEQRTFLAAGHACTDEAKAAGFQRFTPPHRVEEVGVATVDQDVAGLEVGRQVVDGLVDRRPGLHHHQDPARPV